MVKVREDMTSWKMWEHGQPDSKLIVIKQIEDHISSSGQHDAQYLCKCRCGSIKDIIALAKNIRAGNVISCGCYRKERQSELKKKYNQYLDEIFEDEFGKYRVGFTSNTNKEFYVDLEDYDKIKDYCWCEHILSNGYHTLEAGDRVLNKTIRMQWIIVGKHYDHINRNPLDNRKRNLRKASLYENARNHNRQKSNTSGFIGVSYRKDVSKWSSYITWENKRVNLGIFKNKEDAILARLQAEAEYFGEFAPQSYLFEQYNVKRVEEDVCQ